MTKRDHTGDVDLVPSDPVMRRDQESRKHRPGLGPRGERLRQCAPSERPVRPDLVVIGDEAIDLSLELAYVRCRRVLGQPLLLRLVEALDLAAGLWVIGRRVAVGDPERRGRELHRAATTPRRRGEPRSVVAEHRCREVVG